MRIFVLAISLSVLLSGCTNVSTITITNSDINSVTAVSGDSCSQLGLQSPDADGRMLECRRVKDWKLAFIPTDSNVEFRDPNIPNDLELCQLQDARVGVEGPNSIAFPLINQEIPITGSVGVAVVPVDFPDVEGDEKTLRLVDENITKINRWLLEFAKGELEYEWHVAENWVRAPRESKYYAYDHGVFTSPNQVTVSENSQLQNMQEIEYQLFSEIEKVIDLTKVQYVYLLFPENVTRIRTELSSRNVQVRTENGQYLLGYWGGGKYFQRNGYALWQAWIHEIMHSHGLALHTPDGPWSDRYEIGSNSSAWLSWNSFISGWWDDRDILCVDGRTISTALEVDLKSLDHPYEEGYKSVIIALSATKGIVIESRRNSEWTDFGPGFYGLQAYVVDTTKGLARCDSCEKTSEFLKTQWSYYLETDGENHKDALHENWKHIAFVGEKFKFQDVQITFQATGSFDTVRIEKTSG